ncbi:ATP-binding protein [Chengkuizengella marina]|nr:ATP-binding protein [Chengkuizengella marina]
MIAGTQAIAQAVSLIPSSVNLWDDDLRKDAYCCLGCKKEIKRIKTGLGNLNPLPSCKCKIDEYENEVCEREQANRRARQDRIMKQSLISETLKQVSFDNFILRSGTERAYSEFKSFADDFDNQTFGKMVYGTVGNGKSHLAAATHHELYEQGYVTLFLDCSQLFNLVKDTMNRNSKITIMEIINAAISCDLLTLDELGSGCLTEYEYNSILYPIINGRMGKKTNYTTNLNLKELKQWFAKDKYGNPLDHKGRMLDRIIGSCDIFENIASSKRQEDAMKRLGVS